MSRPFPISLLWFGVLLLLPVWELWKTYDAEFTRSSLSLSSVSSALLLRNTDVVLPVVQNYSVAHWESYGFFDDISHREWNLLKQRVQQVYPNTLEGSTPTQLRTTVHNMKASEFYQDYYEPEFACRHERRVGRRGDGGKWICDPHRLQAKPDCLVYSVGSEGDASFEAAVRDEIGSHCEIHTFDMGPYREQVERSGSHFHQWGIASQSTLNGQSYTGPDKKVGRGQFKSLSETIQLLNHTGRTIDVFKMDCEYCEWEVFPAFFEAGVHLQQILIELHAFQKPMPMPQTMDFFQNMSQHEYVIFHKEVNIKHWVGEAIEYAFFKLRPEFFEGLRSGPAGNNTTVK
jgi:hypothetical protein